MLIKCPECQLQLSDKAFTCPHCGYPIVPSAVPVKRKSTRRMRLPNGFGQITEIKNRNLRKPFRAMITIGFTDEGKPICKILKPDGYFKTYNDAYEALMEYNRNPYDIVENFTLKDVFDRWFDTIVDKSKPPRNYNYLTSLWNKVKPIENMNIRDVKTYHIKDLIEGLDATADAKVRVKSVMNRVFDYAIEHEIVHHNVAKAFKISAGNLRLNEREPKAHIDFEEYEIKALWENKDKYPVIKAMLTQCYMGWRPQELCGLKIENVDLTNWTIKGGMKTTAGKNRIVPIHSCLRNIIEELYYKAKNDNSEYLFTLLDDRFKKGIVIPMDYERYRKRYKRVIDELNLNNLHRAHDPRVHFITQCKFYNVDEYAIKYMAGHSIQDVTESVYTRRKREWYASELEKVIVKYK